MRDFLLFCVVVPESKLVIAMASRGNDVDGGGEMAFGMPPMAVKDDGGDVKEVRKVPLPVAMDMEIPLGVHVLVSGRRVEWII
jgi:hypothetical protein